MKRSGRHRIKRKKELGYKEENEDGIECNKMRLTLVCTTRRRIDVLLIKPKGKVAGRRHAGRKTEWNRRREEEV